MGMDFNDLEEESSESGSDVNDDKNSSDSETCSNPEEHTENAMGSRKHASDLNSRGDQDLGESESSVAVNNFDDTNWYCCSCIADYFKGSLPVSWEGLQKALDGKQLGRRQKKHSSSKNKKRKPTPEENNWKKGKRENRKLTGEAKRAWKEHLKQRKKKRAENKKRKAAEAGKKNLK